MNAYPTRLEVLHLFDQKKWVQVEKERLQKSQATVLEAKNGKRFWLVLIPEILSLISEISEDRGFLSSLKLPQSYLRSRSNEALKKEAYYSSRIEGAVTSLEAALRNMRKKTRNFADESMQMIYNNKLALEFMHRHNEELFSHKMVKELHKILIFNTHRQRPIRVGEYRKGPIYVVDGRGKVVYEGPTAEKAHGMMNQFVEWMNRKPEIHPLVDAALVHLYFVHVHPFDDGNGRSARALSNLYLEKNGYDFINLLSPSDYFEHHKASYYQSIQSAEEHGYDATYFIFYYLEALKDQLALIKDALQKESKIKNIKKVLDKNTWAELNKRQIKALRWMLESGQWISTRKYCKLSRCSDETARKDFLRLQELGLIKTKGSGRSTQYLLNENSI
ncbi:MAG: Fic family protein [Candidatus Omnitrophica bacterium]|nr:Fic family protein [Candidatus Omnitrophota bacterium]